MSNETDNPVEQSSRQQVTSSPYGDRLIAVCGYLLVVASVFSVGSLAGLKLTQSLRCESPPSYQSWLDFLQYESSTMSLLVIGIVMAALGIRLLTTV